jgi:hypothetical protein
MGVSGGDVDSLERNRDRRIFGPGDVITSNDAGPRLIGEPRCRRTRD